MISGWPTCARCNKPVERMTREHNVLEQVDIITVQCHGELEQVRVTMAEMAHVDRVILGRAFVRAKELGTGERA